MTELINYPFSTTFAGVNTLQANGIIDSGDNLPNGIGDRIIISGGYMSSTVSDTDTPTALGLRSEITAPANTLGEYWYTFSFFIPESWNNSFRMSIMQAHDSPNVGDNNPRWPNFALTVENGQITALIPSATLPTELASGTRIAAVPLIKNQWYTACLHVNWQTTTSGFREFFLNQEPMFRQYNVSTAYSDTVGPYLKLGVYDFYHDGGFGTQSASFGPAAVWSGNNGYEAVMGGVPQLVPRLVSI